MSTVWVFLKVGRECIYHLEAEAAPEGGAKFFRWLLMGLILISGCISSGQVISAGLIVIDDPVP